MGREKATKGVGGSGCLQSTVLAPGESGRAAGSRASQPWLSEGPCGQHPGCRNHIPAHIPHLSPTKSPPSLSNPLPWVVCWEEGVPLDFEFRLFTSLLSHMHLAQGLGACGRGASEALSVM